MFVSLTEFNTYINNYEDSTEINALKNLCIGSAEGIIEDFLHYPLTQGTYLNEVYPVYNLDFFYTKKGNVTALTMVRENGEDITESCSIFEDAVVCTRKLNGIITASYTAGWTTQTIPSDIKNAILRIASLLYSEGDGNIALSGKTSESGSKQFIITANYDKFLHPLRGYQRVRL